MNDKQTIVRILAASVILAALASILLAFWPYFYQGVVVSPGSSQQTNFHASLIEANGANVIFLLAVPIALTALGLSGIYMIRNNKPLSTKSLLWILSAIQGLYCLVGAASIGLFYLPAEIALVAAAFKAQRKA